MAGEKGGNEGPATPDQSTALITNSILIRVVPASKIPPSGWIGPVGFATFLEHCTAGSSRSFTAIHKDAGLYCGSRLQSGEVFAYVGSIHNLKDLKVS